MILLIASNKDAASLNIAKKILEKCYFAKENEMFNGNPIYAAELNGRKIKLVTLNQELVYAQNLMDFFRAPELAVFASRHSSESGTPTLSVHTPGNLGEAELGGLPRKVSVSPANAMRRVLMNMTSLKQKMQLQYDVCYECTHHDPSLTVPAMFAELGSSPKQWSDLKAAEAVASAIVNAIAEFDKTKAKAVIGIGGPHYNAKFTKIALENEIAFGHIIPKYALSYVDKEILKQCLDNTLEKVECAVLDWKGIKGVDKQKVVKTLDEIGLPLEKV